MKKTLLALSLLAVAASASAAGLVVEYDYNAIQGAPGGYHHNDYGYVGLTQSTKFGVFDAGLQGTRSFVRGAARDDAGGFEVGYSYPLMYGKVGVVPRIAYGTMNQIDPAPGIRLNARYYMPSVEVNYSVAPRLGVFTSFSHMNGINSDSVARANRLQAGVDYSMTKTMSLRTAYSYNKFGDTNQSGLVLIGTYSF